MAMRKEDRVRRVFAWLLESHPLRRRCELTIKELDKEHQGWVEESDGLVEIFLDRRLPIYAMIETLIHEFAHVKSRRLSHCMEFRRWEHQIDGEFWEWRSGITKKKGPPTI